MYKVKIKVYQEFEGDESIYPPGAQINDFMHVEMFSHKDNSIDAGEEIVAKCEKQFPGVRCVLEEIIHFEKPSNSFNQLDLDTLKEQPKQEGKRNG